MHASKWNMFFDTPEPENKIVMNLLSGSMDIIDAEMVDFLIHFPESSVNTASTENTEVMAQCLERGYIYHNIQEEEDNLQQLTRVWYEALEKKAESITIYPTFTCNLKCVYCFESQGKKVKAGIMSKDMFNALMKAIDEIHAIRGVNESPMVTIFGGEPLLGRRAQVGLIEELLGALKKRNYEIGVISNGVALPQYAKMLADYGVGILEVTIDGPREIHDRRRIFADGRGSFDKVVKGIDSALDQRIHTVVRVNVDDDNMIYLPQLADFIMDKGWLDRGVELDLYAVDAAGGENANRCSAPGLEMLTSVFDLFKSDERTRIFNLQQRTVRFLKDLLYYRRLPFPQINFCGATAGNKYSFDLFGKLYACCCMNACDLENFSAGEFYPELKLDSSAIEMWQQRNILNLPRCHNCPEALLCGGGCTRIALMSGEELASGVFCPPSLKEETQLVLNYYYPQLKKEFLSED